jgi:hypothetical protein
MRNQWEKMRRRGVDIPPQLVAQIVRPNRDIKQ